MDIETTNELKKKLDPKHVKARQGMSYIEGWHAIAEANRIFGFNAWTRETLELTENHTPTKNEKGNFVVSFRARVKVTALGVSREGVGFGNGFNSCVHSAYELAIKEAETDAMKRALMTFGNPFGLALYDKKKENVGVDVPVKEPLSDKEHEGNITAVYACGSTKDLIKAWETINNRKKEVQFSQDQWKGVETAKEERKSQLMEGEALAKKGNAITPDALNAPIESAVQ